MQDIQKLLQEAFISVQQPQTVKKGQMMLNQLKKDINYPIVLLTYISNDFSWTGSLRAAIQLKNWCDTYKNMEQFQRDQYNLVIQNIKENISLEFLRSKDKIQQTLLLGMASLAVVQFPERWSSLLIGLVTYGTNDPSSILKILQLMVQITNKYSYMTRSDPLYSEINFVCDNFHHFLLNVTTNSLQNILKDQGDQNKLLMLQNQMILFYNLNYQDLHPHFEDNLKIWMQILNKVMKLPENQIFFKIKGAALQSILLYASKYKEDVQQSIKGFSQQIWTLCSNASPDPQYDQIVFNSLKYFRSLIMWQDMREFFANNLQNLIANLILPNLKFTKQYQQLYHEDIQTFISYFFKNTQLSTRRAAAIELLQAIVRNYKNFQQFIQNQVQSFTPGQDNSNGQCLLLSLVIQSAPKGFRDVDGVTQLQINGEIITYCYQNLIKNTLNIIFNCCSNNPQKPIEKQINLDLLITTLRFIFYFRIFLPTQELNLILQLCCKMYTKSQQLKQIFLLIVNSIVTLKHGNFMQYKNIVYYYDQNRLKSVAGDIFTMILNYDQQQNQLKCSINKLLYSTIKQLKHNNQQFYVSHIRQIIQSMLFKTKIFVFNNILPLFQALGYLIYNLCLIKSNQCADLQTITQQYFHQNIKNQSDILNFSFQLLSIFLQYNPGNQQFYNNLYNSILNASNWTEQNVSIMSSYLQYIAAYISLHNNRIDSDKQAYETILTKLIQLQHFQLFYRLIRRILKLISLQRFFNSGYMHILVKGTQFISSKSQQGRKMGLMFIFEITFQYNTAQIINCINAVQNGFYQELLIKNKDMIQTLQMFRAKKMMFGSICNALVSKCFSSIENQAFMINLLIQNSTSRFRRDQLLNATHQTAPKLESTYQKLVVFKQIQNIDTSINLDQQAVLVQAYTICYNNNNSITNFITEKNFQRIKNLYERQQNKNK